MQSFDRSSVVAALAAAAGVLVCKLVGLAGPAIFFGAVLGIAAAMLAGSKTRGAKQGGGYDVEGEREERPSALDADDSQAHGVEGGAKDGQRL
jgi:hypothetical protein